MTLPQHEIQNSLQLIIDTFKELRPELLRSYGAIDHITKADNSPVTELDVRVETRVKSRLLEAYPHIGFHGEETQDTTGTSNATWIIDPIDGTSSFIHGLPYCTNMAGLVVDDEIVASVIYQFVTDDLFTALKGQGVYKNGERIAITNAELSNSIVFTGSYVYKHLYDVFEPHKIGLYAPIGASGYEFTLLAQGSIQGVTKLRGKSQIHDDVPGVLIASEAGAEIQSFENKEYDYETLNFVIGTPNIIDVIRQNHDHIKTIIEA